jgi:hypothetical protein
MAAVHNRGKLYALFTVTADDWHEPVSSSPVLGRSQAMVGIATAMFIALFGWGAHYFGWEDPDGRIQLALATCFILGVISGYKAKS